MPLRLVRNLACLLLAVAPGLVSAAEIGVNPTRLELDPRSGTATLRLTNRGTDVARYQLTGFVWEQTREGRMSLTPSDELIVYPTLLVLAPGETRMVRVGTREPPEDLERAWRVFVDELPGGADDVRSVRVLARVGLPVFQPPADPGPRQVGSYVERVGDQLGVVVENTGDTWVMLKSVEFTGYDAQGGVTFSGQEAGWYLLAGGEREFRVPFLGQECERTVNVRVQATTDAGSWTHHSSVGGVACPP